MYLHWSSSLIHLLAPYAKLYFAQRDCQEKFTNTTLEMKHQQSLSCLKRTFSVPKWLILMVECLSEKENPSLTKVKPPGSFPPYEGWNRYFCKRRLAVFMLQLTEILLKNSAIKLNHLLLFIPVQASHFLLMWNTYRAHTHISKAGNEYPVNIYIHTHTHTCIVNCFLVVIYPRSLLGSVLV